jgi:molybdopterin molybdotransferase
MIRDGQPRTAATTSFADAAAAVAAIRALDAETVALDDALGRCLAGDVIAADDLVPFARSAMDGYAVRAIDSGPHVRLPIAQERAYAALGIVAHAPGTATAIATGAAIPAGADAVVPIEDVDVTGALVMLHATLQSGDHVFPAGEDARRGDLLLRAGTRITPGAIGLLAAAGVARPHVVRRPRVRVLSTGDELVSVDATPAFGQIRNSNAPFLRALLETECAEVLGIHSVADTRASFDAALAAARDADVIITSGGASTGERDHVKAALRDAGATFFFSSVAMRPARPTAFARLGPTLIFVLPGNPAALTVAANVFVRPALRRLAGDAAPDLPRLRARLAGDVHARPERVYFAFAAARITAGEIVVTPLGDQCSALTRLGSDANALAIVEPTGGTLRDGDMVEILLTGGLGIAAG